MCFIRLNVIYLPLAKTPLSRKELYGLFFINRGQGFWTPHTTFVACFLAVFDSTIKICTDDNINSWGRAECRLIVNARESGGRGCGGGGWMESTKIETTEKQIVNLGGRSVDVFNYITDIYIEKKGIKQTYSIFYIWKKSQLFNENASKFEEQ